MKHTQFLSTELSLYKEARRRHTTLESTQAILPERMTEAREVTAMDCVYKNPNEGVEDRIQDLLQRMTAEEKIGQMTQIHRAVSSAAVIKDFFIGKFLNHQIKQLNILDYETGLSRYVVCIALQAAYATRPGSQGIKMCCQRIGLK